VAEIVAPQCYIGCMKDQRRQKPTTPQEEGIELRPDAWERFEKTVGKVVKGSPAHRTAKPTDADRPQRKRRGRAADKTSG
jgi:hypothetical protein